MVVIAGASAAMTGSSAARAKEQRHAGAHLRPAATTSTRDTSNGIVPVASSRGRTSLPSMPMSAAMLFFAPPPIATFSADCSTAQDSFNLGDTVCVQVSGAPTSGTVVVLSDPDNFMRSSALDVTSSSQQFTFTLPTDPTTAGTDNRGTWAVALVNTEDNSRRAFATFAVHDPNQSVADVTISKTSLDTDQVTAGNNATYRIFVTNQGPDAASNVTFADNTLPNTTFVSFAQDGTSTFNCTSPAVGDAGSTTCTKATMAAGESASFTAVYKLNSSIANGSDLSDTVGITSATTDSHPSSNSSTVDTTVSNPTNPTCSLTCPNNVAAVADTTQGVDENGNPIRGTFVTLPNATATGSTCGTVTSSTPSGSFFPVGSTPVTYTAADGTTCEFLVTVTTSGSPVSISCPANVNVNADASCQATVNLGTPTTTGDNVTVTSSRSDGLPLSAPFTSGITTVTWTASNDSGTASCTQTVTVNDVTPPVINIPAQTASADASCQAAIPDLTTNPGITDNCACDSADDSTACVGHPHVAVTQSPAPGTLVGLGAHTITLTANDGSSNNNGAGNTTVAEISFTVVDTTPPVFTFVPPAVTAFTGPNATTCDAFISDATLGTATATDNCSVTVTRSPTGNTFPVGTTTVTWTATDGSGNTATATQTVTVIDNTPPIITTNGQTPSLWPANHKYATFNVTDFVSSVFDNCDNISVSDVVIEQVTSDEAENGNGSGNTLNDIVIGSDFKSLQLRAEREGGGNGRVYTITFRLCDTHGNVGHATARVVVPHNPGETPVDSGAHYSVNGKSTCP